MVNGAGFTSGSIARSGVSGGGSTVGMETSVNNELAKVRGFLEGDRQFEHKENNSIDNNMPKICSK